MIYHLPFRDWLELDTKAPAADRSPRRTASPSDGGERRPAASGRSASAFVFLDLALLVEVGLVAAAPCRAIDVAMPTISAGKCQPGASGLGPGDRAEEEDADDRDQIAEGLPVEAACSARTVTVS